MDSHPNARTHKARLTVRGRGEGANWQRAYGQVGSAHLRGEDGNARKRRGEKVDRSHRDGPHLSPEGRLFASKRVGEKHIAGTPPRSQKQKKEKKPNLTPPGKGP